MTSDTRGGAVGIDCIQSFIFPSCSNEDLMQEDLGASDAEEDSNASHRKRNRAGGDS